MSKKHILRAAFRSPLSVVGVAFAALAFGLLVQPERFEKTPAYGNLLDVFPQAVWGTIYAVVALVIAASVWDKKDRTLAVAAHTLSFSLVSAWLLAFVVRYATDSATTIVNVANWSVLLYLVVLSMLELDDKVGGPQ